MDSTPKVSVAGPLICMFDGPAERFGDTVGLVEGSSAEGIREFKFTLAIHTRHLWCLLDSD